MSEEGSGESTPSPPISPKQNQFLPETRWYDNDKTVCFVLCGHFFHVMCLMGCEQVVKQTEK